MFNIDNISFSYEFFSPQNSKLFRHISSRVSTVPLRHGILAVLFKRIQTVVNLDATSQKKVGLKCQFHNIQKI